MKTIDNAIWAALRAQLKIFGVLYNVRVNGWELVDTNSPAIFGVKHSSNADFLLARHIFPRKGKIFATRRIFVPLISYLLHAAGLIPMSNASKNPPPNISSVDYSAYRQFYKLLQENGWVVYAPEAACFPNRVGENIFPGFIMKGTELNVKSYLVGVKYENNAHPWLSFLPGKRGIGVNIEPYDAGNKPKTQVVAEMRHALTRLSGLEQKLGG